MKHRAASPMSRQKSFLRKWTQAEQAEHAQNSDIMRWQALDLPNCSQSSRVWADCLPFLVKLHQMKRLPSHS